MSIQESGAVYEGREYAATREEVYTVIDGERAYQKRGDGNALRHTDAPPMTVGEGILCIEHILGKAREAWYKPVTGAQEALVHLRKAAAVSVQMMELYGAPPRT